jgi:D-serine deaminase-like pyridoxal phosphate-dependent protein
MEVRATADTVEHLGPLALAARDAGATIPVVVDVDMGWRPPLAPEALVLGVRRSPLWEPSRVVALAREVQRTRGLRFAGLLAYEAQLAGLGDRDRHGRAVPTHVLVKALSRPQVRARRRAVCEALVAAGLVPALVNGGGTGSLSYSARDPSVTEVTVGSALLGGTLFDGMTDLAPEPALYFALEVTRAPAEALVTCLGGGYIASGAAGPDRLPSPTLPEGLSLLAREGAGEVQTPLKVRAGLRLLPGDPVFFRHAKSGELAERFASYLLVRGDQVVERVPTYRGEGWCFL